MDNQIKKYLDLILQSREFQNSDSGKRLLTYLVEQSLKNQVPKETEIAIDVFGRDVSYDPSSDSLVRSHIYALRKKLEKYYLTQGRHDKIHVVIPKGRYEVVFTDAPVEAAIPVRSGKNIKAMIVVALLSVMGSFVLFTFVLKSDSAQLSARLPDFPWQEFKHSEKPIMFVIGDLFVYVHRKSDEYGNRRIRNGRINSYEELMEYYESYPEEKEQFSGMTHSYVSPPTYTGAMNLIPLLLKSGLELEYTHASQLTKEDLKAYNIIFVGPLKTLRVLKPYFAQSRYEFDFYPHTLTLDEKPDTTNLKIFNAEIENNLQYRKDYGFVIKVPGPADNTILLVTAFSTTVLSSLTRMIESGALRNMILEQYEEPFPQFFKTLIEVDIVSESRLHTLIEFKKI